MLDAKHQVQTKKGREQAAPRQARGDPRPSLRRHEHAAIERTTGASINTIAKLLCDAGEARLDIRDELERKKSMLKPAIGAGRSGHTCPTCATDFRLLAIPDPLEP